LNPPIINVPLIFLFYLVLKINLKLFFFVAGSEPAVRRTEPGLAISSSMTYTAGGFQTSDQVSSLKAGEVSHCVF